MSTFQIDPYIGQGRALPRKVFFSGSTALQKGQGLCYARDYVTTTTGQTAADAYGGRDKIVELPDNSNNLWFAGVAADDYEAVSGGKWIEICEPGSVCRIGILAATTIGSTRLTAIAGLGNEGSGRFGPAGFIGRGSAVALQTVAAVTGPTDYSIAPISSSIDGSATYTSASKTVTKTGAFANVPATANLQGNEYIYVIGGATDNAGGATGTVATVGRYKIVTKTSDDAVIVETAIASGNIDLAFYCVRGNPTVLAKLDEGAQSGLVEYVSPNAATAAMTCMVGGTTRFFGGFDLDGADATFTLADATQPGLRKAFQLLAAITTNDVQITVTSGLVIDPSQANPSAVYGALAGIEMDAAADYVLLEWCQSKWILLINIGTTLS